MSSGAGYIWGTRGKNWGFRLLRRGGLENPLAVYEEMFSVIDDLPQAFCRVDGKVALRFPDPEGRRDASGRVIPHHFVLLDAEAHGIDSFEDGFSKIWPQVADYFETVWDSDLPPTSG